MATLSIMLTLWAASIRSQLQYRTNFLILVAMGLIYQGTGFAFIWVVLSRFEAIGGWPLGEIAFLYGLRLVMHAISVLLSGYIRDLDMEIRHGQFDRVLIRPLSPLRQIISQGVQVNAFGDLIGGVGLFLAAIAMVDVIWTPAVLLYLVLAIAGGALIELGLDLLIATLALRVLNTQSFFYVIDTFFSDFGNYPLKIFGGTVQFLLTFGLPLAFMAYFPATVLLGRTGELSVPPLLAYAAPAAGVCWFGLAVWVFRHELRAYQSAGH
jgi:ABC-2 type transport system permease protein